MNWAIFSKMMMLNKMFHYQLNQNTGCKVKFVVNMNGNVRMLNNEIMTWNKRTKFHGMKLQDMKIRDLKMENMKMYWHILHRHVQHFSAPVWGWNSNVCRACFACLYTAYIFMSCNFMSCDFESSLVSRLAFPVNPKLYETQVLNRINNFIQK